MAWQQPKTDWNSTDHFNTSDYNRIKANIEYLQELAKEISWPVKIEDMGADKTEEEYPYADEINTISDNLEKIVAGSYPINIGTKTTYEDNGAFIGYADLNRIESGCISLYTNINRMLSSRRRIAFRLGDRREPFC